MNIVYKKNGREVSKEEFDEGTDPELLKEMLESRTPCRGMTDDVFLSGVGNLSQQMNTPELMEVTQGAMAHGYVPKPTDFYNTSLARFPGDPEAFLNHGQGRGHIQEILKKRGMRMNRDGEVVVVEKPEEDPYLNPVHKLHPNMIKKIKKRKLKEKPELAEMDPAELNESILHDHGWNEKR